MRCVQRRAGRTRYSARRRAGALSAMPLVATTRRAAGGILSKTWRLVRDRSYRSAVWLRLAGASAFQLSGRTYENRYPYIFSFVQTELRAIPRAHVLSFGCSTGAEVFWLRRYFPDAVIKGVDVNGASIAVCRERAKREGDGNVSFAVADFSRRRAAGVLRRDLLHGRPARRAAVPARNRTLRSPDPVRRLRLHDRRFRAQSCVPGGFSSYATAISVWATHAPAPPSARSCSCAIRREAARSSGRTIA